MKLGNAIASAISPRSFELILLPTEQCNFRCFYCYEDFKLKSMKRSTIDGIKSLISRKGDLDHLSISWFGGEPMLAMPIIAEIGEYAQSLVRAGKIGMFRSAITTNGFFLNDINLDALYAAGVKKFQITLDGDCETHDAIRKDARGRGTFEVIWNHLENMKHRVDLGDLEIFIRLHYQRRTADKIKAFIPKIDQTFLSDPRFRLLFHSVEPLGGPNDKEIERLSRTDKAGLEAEFHALMVQGQQLARTFLEPDGVYVCYAAKTNSLVIRSDGSLAKCTVALADTRNRIGVLNADGSVSVDGQKMRLWIDTLKSTDLRRLACPYSFMSHPTH